MTKKDIRLYHTEGDEVYIPTDGLPEDIAWIAYYYESGDYEGSGSALIAWNDGTFNFTSLSHCSCNGPLDDIYTYNRDKYPLVDIQEWMYKDHNRKDLVLRDYDEKYWRGMWDAVKIALKKEGVSRKKKVRDGK